MISRSCSVNPWESTKLGNHADLDNHDHCVDRAHRDFHLGVRQTFWSGRTNPTIAGNIDNIMFDTVIRGYRQDQVDDVIEHLKWQVDSLNAQLEQAHLRAKTFETG